MNKHRSTALGLALAVSLSVVAFAAMTAQGANLGNGGTAGKFRVEGSTALSVNRTFTGQLEALTNTMITHIAFTVPGVLKLLMCINGHYRRKNSHRL